jgi:predicted NBD/HSP70 family sugar kinase
VGVNALNLKQSNVYTVLWTLCSCKTSTTKALARKTDLSFATVGNILNALMETGEVLLGEQVASAGGRPAQSYTFHAEYAHVLAVSARVQDGVHTIQACVGNLYGEVVWETRQSFDTIRLASLETVVEACLRQYPNIRVMSFALPGVEHNGRILMNDYKELIGVPFQAHFQEKYGLPVIVENDVNAAVLGHCRETETPSVTVGIYFPQTFPPGAGIMINGSILKGARGYAGEVALLELGIDWLAVDYGNPAAIGSAITRLIGMLSGILNPDQVVLYGDFLSLAVQERIRQEIPALAVRDIFPTLNYTSDLNTDIIAGLMKLAVSVYQQGKTTSE